MLSVCGRTEAHLLKRKLWFLMQMRSWDPEELIYFKNSFISFANELLGIPRPTYLKKLVISYANELQRVPKQKTVISFANEAWGFPGSLS
jgi:hypothetical protein